MGVRAEDWNTGSSISGCSPKDGILREAEIGEGEGHDIDKEDDDSDDEERQEEFIKEMTSALDEEQQVYNHIRRATVERRLAKYTPEELKE